MDRGVLRDVWQGQLPLCFKLHPDDVDGMHRPEPYYMMVPRITYFPIVIDRVVKYFNRFMDQNKQASDDIWLDYDGQPIKWQHPIGLSWDLFGSSYDLPWRLILHFSDFPAKELVKCNTKASIKINFMSSIKEADALKHKGSVTRNMLEKDQDRLWSSLVNDKFEQFWSVNKRLMDEEFNSIPYRLYFPDYTYVQKIVRPCTTEKSIFRNPENKDNHAQLQDCTFFEHRNKSNHRSTTMLDLIQTTFINRIQDLVKHSPIEGPIDVNLFKFRFITHGIEIPFNSPVQWLSEHLSYPDNFLHICAVNKSSDS